MTGKKYSVFMVTINSNVDHDKATDDQKESFKKIAKYVFSNHIQKYITFIDEKHKDIYSIDSQYRFEIAPTNNRLHLHGIIKISHNSKIKLDIPSLRELINRAWKQSVHLNIKGKGDDTKAWEDYMNKGKSANVIQL